MGEFWIWALTIGVFAFVIMWRFGNDRNIAKAEKDLDEFLKKKGIDTSSKISLGTYVGGHPDIDKTMNNIFSFKHNNRLSLYVKQYRKSHVGEPQNFQYLSDIPIESIKNISIEDASSIERKVTLGRIMLVGIFALAWKKNQKNEQAFLNIHWQDGKYEHETLFHFESKDAFQNANTARNNLIRQSR